MEKENNLNSIFDSLPQLMSPREAAQILGISPLTLANRRSKKLKPAYVVFGRRVRYPKPAVIAYLQDITRFPGDENE